MDNLGLVVLLLLLQSVTLKAKESSPTDFILEPQDILAARNSTVSFTCFAHKTGRIDYFWKFDGNYLDVKAQSDRYALEAGGTKLIIKHLLTETTDGKYQCVARTESGAFVSRTATAVSPYIKVLGNPGQGPSVTAVKGSYAFLKATPVKSVPAATFRWRRRVNGIYRSLSGTMDYYVASNGDLFLPAVKISGSFQLTVSNHMYFNGREFHLRTVNLNVTGSITPGSCPNKYIEKINPLQTVTVNRGDEVAILECMVASKLCWSPPNVTWDLGDGKVYRGMRLTIVKPKLSDAKGYKCVAKQTRMQTHEFTVFLKVREKPRWTKVPGRFTAIISDSFLEAGQYEGSPEVLWYVDGDQVIRRTNKYEVRSRDKALMLKKVTSAHSGIYQVFLRNPAGESSYAIRVTVQNGCGWKITGNSGTINFTSQYITDPSEKCGWLIQVPFPSRYKFTFRYLKFNGASGDCIYTRMGLIQKSRTSVTEIWSYCDGEPSPSPVPLLSGPYITLLATVKLDYLKNGGGFVLYFEVENAPVTLTPTQTSTTTGVITSLSTTVFTNSTISVSTRQTQDELPVWVVGVVAGLGAALIILAFIIYVAWRKRQLHRITQREANGNIVSHKKPYNHVCITAMDSPSSKPMINKGFSETSFRGGSQGSVIAVNRTNRPTLSQSYSDPIHQMDAPVYMVCGTPDYQCVADALAPTAEETNSGPDMTKLYKQHSVPDYELPYELTAQALQQRESVSYDYPYEPTAFQKGGAGNTTVPEEAAVYEMPVDSIADKKRITHTYDVCEPNKGIINVGFQDAEYAEPECDYAAQDASAYEPSIYEPLEQCDPNAAAKGTGTAKTDQDYAGLNPSSDDTSNYQSYNSPAGNRRNNNVYDMPEEGVTTPRNDYQALGH